MDAEEIDDGYDGYDQTPLNARRHARFGVELARVARPLLSLCTSLDNRILCSPFILKLWSLVNGTAVRLFARVVCGVVDW
jgi:hypothetical protein